MEYVIHYCKASRSNYKSNSAQYLTQPGHYIHIHWHHSRTFEIARNFDWTFQFNKGGTRIKERIEPGPWGDPYTAKEYLVNIYQRHKYLHDKVGCCIYLYDLDVSYYYGWYFNYASHILKGKHFNDGEEYSGAPFSWYGGGTPYKKFYTQSLVTDNTLVQRHPSGGFAIYGE
jgi:hypothetical protein